MDRSVRFVFQRIPNRDHPGVSTDARASHEPLPDQPESHRRHGRYVPIPDHHPTG